MTQIKGVIFDLDNTLLDFMKMKEFAVKSAIKGMIEAGLLVDEAGRIRRYLTCSLKNRSVMWNINFLQQG